MLNKQKRIVGLILFIGILLISGCGNAQANTKVILTTGFEKDELFRIETMSCTMPEVMVYLTNTQNQYESVFGKEIWGTDLEGKTLEESVKETVLAQLAQIKTMNLLAAAHGVALSEAELETVRTAAKAYFESLNPTEREQMSVTEDTICNLYTEYALANKVYEYLIKDINPEISDDEARTITVQHILIKTYALDGTGKKIDYSESAKEDAYKTASEILALAMEEGTDFEELVLQYSEGESGDYSFGKGEEDVAFETAAFNLGKGEISEVVETEFGYHIIKCINTFNREETDANKIKIIEKKREEVFGQEYDAFVITLTRDLNEELWETITFIQNADVKTQDFFDVYNQYFS